MISRIIDEKSVSVVRQMLAESERIVVTCHLTPDGDAMGSSLGLYHVLSALGKDVAVVTPDMMPRTLNFLPGVKDVTVFTRHEEYATKLLNEADLIFCLDFNEPKRVDRMAPALMAAKGKKVMIDHHEHPAPDFVDLIISHPESSSTAMLVFRMICRLELFDLISRPAAECIFTGMMTDTGNFSYNSNEPDLYIVIAELLKKGIDKDRLYARACNTYREQAVRLCGYALGERMTIDHAHGCSLIAISADDLRRFDYEKGDTEGLVNKPLAIPEVVWSVYLREDPEQIKVSMRSKGSFPVNRVCSDLFGGGGHLNAAGAEFKGSLADCIERIRQAMPSYDKYLPRNHKK